MKKKSAFILFVVLCCSPLVDAASSSTYWVNCWMTGVELSKNRHEYPEAIKAYTAAIKNQPSDQISQHLYLYNERGRLYLKMDEHQKAIQDFSFVLDHPNVNKEEMLDALWGRGQAYLASGKAQEFETDRKRLDEIEPFVRPLEDNQDYLILKMGNHVARDPQSQERFVKVLLIQKKIKSKQDVTFTPSGLAIVRKAQMSLKR